MAFSLPSWRALLEPTFLWIEVFRHRRLKALRARSDDARASNNFRHFLPDCGISEIKIERRLNTQLPIFRR
jgi:hypothetical protein